MKLPLIQGREVVPVRLIPIITHGELGPETLSGILANRLNVGGWQFSPDFDGIETDATDEEAGCTEGVTETREELAGPQWRDNGISAYHLHDGKTPAKMWVSEWETIYHEIKLLEPVLRKEEEKNGVEQSMEPVWRRKATKVLPSGAFLWRDDLDVLWKAHTNYYMCTPFEPADFRKGVNYNAYIRPGFQALVWDGFEHLRTLSRHEREANGLSASESARLIRIGYSDFVRLCRVDDPAQWVSWLTIRSEGVWISSPPDDTDLTATERATWCEHPEKDLSKPLLTFPCSLTQLQHFLENTGVYGCIDPFDLAEFVLRETDNRKDQPSDCLQGPPKPNLKAQESLLKMVIAMALDGYGYDPHKKKSPFPKELAEIVESLGLSIDTDTVRKWLQEGAAFLPRPENGD